MQAVYERREQHFDIFHAHSITFFPHIHAHVETMLVKSGTIHLIIGDQEKTLHAGEMAIVFPNTVHSYLTKDKSETVITIFHVDMTGDYAHKLTHYRPLWPFLSSDMLHKDVLSAHEALLHSDLPSALNNAYLSVLLGRVLQKLELKKRPVSDDEDLLHRLLMYLDKSYQQSMSLDTLAQALNVSRYRISRCFARQIGCTFTDYLNALRADYAASLLRLSDLSAADAGYEAGFDSISTYYRAFQKRHGLSPKRYKTQWRA